MQLSRKAYSKYLNNKIYLHALNIWSANKKTYELLVANTEYIPDELFEDVLDLLNHYGIWMAQFSEHERQTKPSLSDPFIFHHLDVQSSFPKQGEERIFAFYHQLKSEVYN